MDDHIFGVGPERVLEQLPKNGSLPAKISGNFDEKVLRNSELHLFCGHVVVPPVFLIFCFERQKPLAREAFQ